jgi:hypothetical protein
VTKRTRTITFEATDTQLHELGIALGRAAATERAERNRLATYHAAYMRERHDYIPAEVELIKHYIEILEIVKIAVQKA